MILVKKIVPFNNVLTFDTDVCEITAISLEHDIKTSPDAISGVFYITGEYKITDGQLEKDKFNFELPFDIALGCEYDLNTLIVDIDDFRYEQISRNEVKVNIDVYIDGEVVSEPVLVDDEVEAVSSLDERNQQPILTEEKEAEETHDTIMEPEEPAKVEVTERLDLLDEILDNKEDTMSEEIPDINIENNNENTNNIFNAFNEEEQYVTYRVYRVTDNDTLNSILEKYNVSKEELAKYNSIDDIHPGDKLIIPYNDK